MSRCTNLEGTGNLKSIIFPESQENQNNLPINSVNYSKYLTESEGRTR